MPAFIDLTGNRYGKLVVLERTENVKKKTIWLCECDCGNLKKISGESLKQGYTKSCGCWVKTRPSTESPTYRHGKVGSPEYNSWVNMKSRCLTETNPAYHNYGGRGLDICDRWLDDKQGFNNFYEDMGQKPKGTSLDRIDNNKGYSPENCRWADRRVQARNQRKQEGTKSRYRGVIWYDHLDKWAAKIWDAPFKKHLGVFIDEVEAAKAFDDYARKIGYEEAWLNFPKEER